MTSQTKTETRTIWKEVETDTAFVRVPVEEAYQIQKTPEMKAQEAADMVLKARRERFNISTGNTDAATPTPPSAGKRSAPPSRNWTGWRRNT